MSKKQIAKIAYIVIFMLVLVIPGIGTFIWKQEAIGNEEAVDFKDMNYGNAAEKIDDYFSVKFGFVLHINLGLYLVSSVLSTNHRHHSIYQNSCNGREDYHQYWIHLAIGAI